MEREAPVLRSAPVLVIALLAIVASTFPPGAVAATAATAERPGEKERSEATTAADATAAEAVAAETRTGESSSSSGIAAAQQTIPWGTVTEVSFRRWAVAVFGGSVLGQGVGLDDGNAFGGTVTWFGHPNLGAEAGVWYTTQELLPTTGNEVSGGDLDSYVVTGNAVIRYAVHRRVVPYGTAGIAYFAPDYTIDPGVVENLESFGFTVAEDVESAVGFNVGGGIEALLTSRLGIFADARYFVGSADTSSTLTHEVTGSDTDSGTQDLDGFTLVAGFRFHF